MVVIRCACQAGNVYLSMAALVSFTPASVGIGGAGAGVGNGTGKVGAGSLKGGPRGKNSNGNGDAEMLAAWPKAATTLVSCQDLGLEGWWEESFVTSPPPLY